MTDWIRESSTGTSPKNRMIRNRNSGILPRNCRSLNRRETGIGRVHRGHYRRRRLFVLISVLLLPQRRSLLSDGDFGTTTSRRQPALSDCYVTMTFCCCCPLPTTIFCSTIQIAWHCCQRRLDCYEENLTYYWALNSRIHHCLDGH